MQSQPEHKQQSISKASVFRGIDTKLCVVNAKKPEKTDDATLAITLVLIQNDGSPLRREVVVKPSTTMKELYAYTKYLFRDVLCDAYTQFVITKPEPTEKDWSASGKLYPDDDTRSIEMELAEHFRIFELMQSEGNPNPVAQPANVHYYNHWHPRHTVKDVVADLTSPTLLVQWKRVRTGRTLTQQQFELVVQGMFRESREHSEQSIDEAASVKDTDSKPCICPARKDDDALAQFPADLVELCAARCSDIIDMPDDVWHMIRSDQDLEIVEDGRKCHINPVHLEKYPNWWGTTCTARGTLTVRRGETCSWTLRLHGPDTMACAYSKRCYLSEVGIATTDGQNRYSWPCGQAAGRKSPGGPTFSAKLAGGDIVRLRLDLSEAEGPGGVLTIGDGESGLHPLFKDLDVNKDYCLIASMHDDKTGAEIEIVAEKQN